MKVDSVIAIGPSQNFYPLTSQNNPLFMLSFMNENLLQHTLRHLAPFSNKIFIFCIEEYKEMVGKLVKGFSTPIEIISTEGYDGLGFVLCVVRSKTTASTLLLCKADMYFPASIDYLVENFEKLGDDIHGYIYKTGNTEPVMVLDGDGRLYVYDSERMPHGHIKVLITNEYKLKNLYIIRTKLLVRLTVLDFGFKRSILKKLMKNKSKFRVFRDDNFSVSNLKDFESQLLLKTAFLESSPDCLFGENVEILEENEIQDCIVGDGCKIDRNSKLTRCILMEGVVIEQGCTLTDSVIGANSIIGRGSVIIKSRVSNNYYMSENTHCENESLNFMDQ
ncbi:hypothetical protein PAEPH01_0098 [Pancytospora epiphaga]|nr:hypothetical protein PAEPH01_0098 [Pancytospora epiphaga]